MVLYILRNFDREDKFVLVSSTVIVLVALLFCSQVSDQTTCFTPQQFTDSWWKYSNKYCGSNPSFTKVPLNDEIPQIRPTEKLTEKKLTKMNLILISVLMFIWLPYLLRGTINMLLGQSVDVRTFMSHLNGGSSENKANAEYVKSRLFKKSMACTDVLVALFWLLGKLISVAIFVVIAIYLQSSTGAQTTNEMWKLYSSDYPNYPTLPNKFMCTLVILSVNGSYTLACIDSSAGIKSVIILLIWIWSIICCLCQSVSAVKWIVRITRRQTLDDYISSFGIPHKTAEQNGNGQNVLGGFAARFLLYMTLENDGGCKLGQLIKTASE